MTDRRKNIKAQRNKMNGKSNTRKKKQIKYGVFKCVISVLIRLRQD